MIYYVAVLTKSDLLLLQYTLKYHNEIANVLIHPQVHHFLFFCCANWDMEEQIFPLSNKGFIMLYF